jgi:DNA adenine methylase
MKQSPVLRYAGGKTWLIPLLSNFVPSTVKTLYAPFVGGGAFELYCAQELGLKVVASDTFEPLVNFWQCWLRNAHNVYMEAKKLYPMTKAKFRRISDEFQDCKDNYKRAAWYYVLNRSSYAGITLARAGYVHGRFTLSGLEKLRRFKCNNIKVSCLDYSVAIPKVPRNDPTCLLFLDPPYVVPGKYYGPSAQFDHRNLRDMLLPLSSSTYWVLTYNDCPEVRSLYKGCKIIPVTVHRQITHSSAKEVVVMSKALLQALNYTENRQSYPGTTKHHRIFMGSTSRTLQ